jgi:hypothetical protein
MESNISTTLIAAFEMQVIFEELSDKSSEKFNRQNLGGAA